MVGRSGPDNRNRDGSDGDGTRRILLRKSARRFLVRYLGFVAIAVLMVGSFRLGVEAEKREKTEIITVELPGKEVEVPGPVVTVVVPGPETTRIVPGPSPTPEVIIEIKEISVFQKCWVSIVRATLRTTAVENQVVSESGFGYCPDNLGLWVQQ